MTKKKEIDTLYSSVSLILSTARNNAYRAVNSEMVRAYWEIGKLIVEDEQQGKSRADYGEETLKKLSKKLTSEFGRGFSYANLRNFRQFYLTFPDGEKCYALRSILTWTNYRLIMRVENSNARKYYVTETASQNWSSRELERNINSAYYERLLSTQKNKKSDTDQADFENYLPADFINDPFVFEFLNIQQPSELSESEIETSLISHLEKLLLELGRGFSFVGRQFRISTETSHFYIDLVFYNYILKCFVLVDLKTTKLAHQDIGRMDMYVRLFDDLQKQENDNPTIGAILCTDKDETIVKYSVMNENKKLFATKYQMYLPTEKQLADWIAKDRELIITQLSNSKIGKENR